MGSFSIFHWIIAIVFILILWGLVSAITSGVRRDMQGPLFCTTCGNEGATRVHTKGSIFIEILLWLCLLVPGLIYSIWRMTTKVQVCGACGAQTLVPQNSPVAQKMRKELKAS